MRRVKWSAAGIAGGAAFLLCGAPVRAQFQAERYKLTAAERQALEQRRDRLKQGLEAYEKRLMKTAMRKPPPVADVEIYLDAVDRNLRQNLFFTAKQVTQALGCLKEGETRLAALQEGKTPWVEQTGVVVLGYHSRIDDSAQPYQVYIPPTHDFKHPTPARLDIFLHGRAAALNEIAYLRGSGWLKGEWGGTPPLNYALYPYGRGNNGWRYAGEQDVFEALSDFRNRFPIDNNQVTLRGFSMGGHGAWHLGLQHPGEWAAVSPGAGFVETRRYSKVKADFPDWQQALLHLYDALDYAENGLYLPLLPYVGEQDPVKPQHELMYTALRAFNVHDTEFVGPNVGHRYEPKTLQSLLAALAVLKRDPDESVEFVTYTLRFAACRWVHLTGLERHWQRGDVLAVRPAPGQIIVRTTNVSALRLTPSEWQAGGTVSIDTQELKTTARQANGIALVKRGGKWAFGEPTGLRKSPGLQGPIDDALFGPTLAVSGTGTAWNAAAGDFAKQELQRFRDGWGLYFRATLPETTDTQLTADAIRDHNLYLFGDPNSNAVLRRLLPGLPLQWTKDTLTIAGKTFDAHDHLPLLVFPNPEAPNHYVVIDSGFTFSRADWENSNARQYPHLPDYAVIHLGPVYNDDRSKDTVLAGFFDEQWRIPGAK